MRWQLIVSAILSTVALGVSIHTLVRVRQQRRRLLDQERRLQQQRSNRQHQGLLD